jgi:hypothetical protein
MARRPPKPPVQPLRPGQSGKVGIGLLQEKLIGRVVVERSKLESSLHDLIWRMLGIEIDDGRILTARMDAVRLIGIIRALAPRKLKEPQLQTLLDVLITIDELRDDRNFIAHGTWGALLPENIPVSLSLRAKANPREVTAEDFPHERMHAIAKEIIRTKWVVVGIFNSLPQPSYDKSEQPASDDPSTPQGHPEDQTGQ